MNEMVKTGSLRTRPRAACHPKRPDYLDGMCWECRFEGQLDQDQRELYRAGVPLDQEPPEGLYELLGADFSQGDDS